MEYKEIIKLAYLQQLSKWYKEYEVLKNNPNNKISIAREKNESKKVDELSNILCSLEKGENKNDKI